jgi:hypothetical protein
MKDTILYTPIGFYLFFGIYFAWYYLSGFTILIEEARNRKRESNKKRLTKNPYE